QQNEKRTNQSSELENNNTRSVFNMAVAKPVYVNHRKWFMFLFGDVMLFLGLFGSYLIVITAPLGSEELTPGNLIVDFFAFGFFLLAIYPVWAFLKSKRIEFYDEFVRVF